MGLNALLLSQDVAVVELRRPLLPEMGLHTDQCGSPLGGCKRLATQNYEAIIVDADLPGAFDFMASLRHMPTARHAIIFSITKSASMTRAFQAGANFVLPKPLSAERALRSFRAAQGLMLGERRRYYRHPVSLPAVLAHGNKIESVMLTNLSEGGMAIEITSPLVIGQMLKWKFALPENMLCVEGKGEVSWADGRGNAGIRFVHVPQPYKVLLEEWLSTHSLEVPQEIS